MKVEIKSIADKGVKEKERIIFKVVSDTDIGDHVLIQTGYSNGEVTVATFHTYWFPYKAVAAGDLVVLYSKSGKESEKTIAQNKRTHFFYWGLEVPIWNRNDRAPVLLHAPEWVSKGPDEL
ncbi:hypothetical protein GMST_31610 [Geomonas silvestris]|uniref:Uncharacterized protein n=1 Tax=Geomonas silvestris TaxID=2740184 RepID=A0A6V8MLF8_9BACT|nr:hypothetical protein [Geomonas silvestris]GFO60836.1 hypothetical protein GMST_31610 [Geomonas silvestris]